MAETLPKMLAYIRAATRGQDSAGHGEIHVLPQTWNQQVSRACIYHGLETSGFLKSIFLSISPSVCLCRRGTGRGRCSLKTPHATAWHVSPCFSPEQPFQPPRQGWGQQDTGKHSQPISMTQMEKIFSELVLGETLPNPTLVRLLKVK